MARHAIAQQLSDDTNFDQAQESQVGLLRVERDLEMAASGIKGAAVGAAAGFKGGKVIVFVHR